MRDTIVKVALFGALVAIAASLVFAQSATWTNPRTWSTDDLLTAGQFNQQFRDNLLWLRQEATLTGTAALDDLGCSGTRSADTFLRGDCEWAELPTQYVLAWDMSNTGTTSRTFVDAGDPATIGVTSGNVRVYVTGTLTAPAATQCTLRMLNATTNTELFTINRLGATATFGLTLYTDTAPSTTSDNTYQVQMRSSGGGSCSWSRNGSRRGLAVFADAA